MQLIGEDRSVLRDSENVLEMWHKPGGVLGNEVVGADPGWLLRMNSNTNTSKPWRDQALTFSPREPFRAL